MIDIIESKLKSAENQLKSIESKLKSIEHISIEINWKSIEINWKSIEHQLKSIEHQLKVNWNQLNINWNQLNVNWNQLKSIEHQLKVNWTSIEHQLKSIERQLKSIEINWSHIIQYLVLKKIHPKVDPKIVSGGPTLNHPKASWCQGFLRSSSSSMFFPYSRLHKCGTPMLHRSCQPRWPLHLHHPCRDLHRRNHTSHQDRPWFESSRHGPSKRALECVVKPKALLSHSENKYLWVNICNHQHHIVNVCSWPKHIGEGRQYYSMLPDAITECSASLCQNQGWNAQKTKAMVTELPHLSTSSLRSTIPTIIEGSLEVKLPTIWTDEKQSRAEAERRGRLEERRSEEKESGRKKMQMREKVGKSRNTVFFQWFVAPEGRKVGSLKRRVRSQLARWAMKNCTPLWREAHFEVKMYKAHQVRTTFGSWDVEKVHAVVARSTFPSQKC